MKNLTEFCDAVLIFAVVILVGLALHNQKDQADVDQQIVNVLCEAHNAYLYDQPRKVNSCF